MAADPSIPRFRDTLAEEFARRRAVNVALQRLLRLGQLSMPDRATWTRAER